MVRVRFAPSPTGYIHIGNTRIALFNWLFAVRNKGSFILRYDNTDLERSKQEYIEGISEDLAWLGITPVEIEYQAKRFSRYDEVAEELKDKKLLYPCFETSEELELRRKIRLSRGLPPIYGRESLKLTAEEINQKMVEGKKPHWRFLLPNFKEDPHNIVSKNITWEDEVKGKQCIDLSSLSDPILIREDGTYLYTLPSVVDDIDMKITHIIRGDDHVTNSAAQIAIFEALGANLPKMGHINLLTRADGGGLSKRNGALSIRDLRKDGYLAMSIASLASLIGTSQNVIAYKTMSELADVFELTSTSKSAAKFSMEDLDRINRDLLLKSDYGEIANQLDKYGIRGEKAEAFWYMIRGNITRLTEIKAWWDVLDVEAKFNPTDKEFLAIAAKLLPEDRYDETSWKSWTNSIKEATGRKGKELFMPLRLAITGQEHGPDLSKLMPLLDYSSLIKRLT